MIYQTSIVTSLGGSSVETVRTLLTITKGLIYQIEVYFPQGCSGLVGLQIYDGALQIAPIGQGEFFIGDGDLISFNDLYWKKTSPYKLSIYTYNSDTAYNHTVTVRIGIHLRTEFINYLLPTQTINKLVDIEKAINLLSVSLVGKIPARNVFNQFLGIE